MTAFLRSVVLLALGVAGGASAQDGLLAIPPADPPVALSGDVRHDLLAASTEADGRDGAMRGRDGVRNPALAFGLSAVVPGAGQVYNGSLLRAVAYAGLEAGLWLGYATWHSQGMDGLEAYEAFAHQQWSPVQYAEWLNNYPGYGGTGINTAVLDGIDLTNPDGWSDGEWATVEGFFEDLRAAERQSRFVNGDGTGSGLSFSHVLDDIGEQQYYELIGKYFQYGPGWSDWCAGRDPLSEACLTIEDFDERAQFATKTDLFFAYAEDHADANTLLRRASRVTSFVLLNHAFSAFDALLTARFHNRGLQVQSGMSLEPDGLGGARPTARLTVRF